MLVRSTALLPHTIAMAHWCPLVDTVLWRTLAGRGGSPEPGEMPLWIQGSFLPCPREVAKIPWQCHSSERRKPVASGLVTLGGS